MVAHGTVQLLKFEGPPTPIDWLPNLADIGMTLFFVLSGFVIHYNYRRKVTEQGLVWARFARLYPLFLFMLVLDVLLGRKLMVFVADNVDGFQDVLGSLPYYLLLVQSWFYVPFGDSSLIYVTGSNIALSWSISTEWFFYISQGNLRLPGRCRYARRSGRRVRQGFHGAIRLRARSGAHHQRAPRRGRIGQPVGTELHGTLGGRHRRAIRWACSGHSRRAQSGRSAIPGQGHPYIVGNLWPQLRRFARQRHHGTEQRLRRQGDLRLPGRCRPAR
jgi:hypothetical protein